MPWYSYRLVEFDPPAGGISKAALLKSHLQLFKLKYDDVKVRFISADELLSWELNLVESRKRLNTRSADRASRIDLPPITRKFYFALGEEDAVLYVNRIVNKNVQTILRRVLHCKKFEIMQLRDGVNSSAMHKYYTQSRIKNPCALDLQYKERMIGSVEQLKNGLPLSSSVEAVSEKNKEAYQKLGTPSEIPEIRKVAVSLENVPLNTKNPKLKDFRFGEMEVEVTASSVMHLYVSLAEDEIVKSIPPWLEKLRIRGTTECSAHYN